MMLSWLAGAKPWWLTKAVSINKPHYVLPLPRFCVGFLGCLAVGVMSVLLSVMFPELVLPQYKMLKYTW